jgi:hypothetical protein
MPQAGRQLVICRQLGDYEATVNWPNISFETQRTNPLSLSHKRRRLPFSTESVQY